MFNFEELTLDDIELIEQLTGSPIESITAEENPKGKTLKVLIWVMKRKTEPNFTIEQAGLLSFKEAVAMFNSEDQEKKD
jgi:hypothetical protein